MKLASKVASRSICRCQHGAVVAKGNRVFGAGYNKMKEHPTWGGYLKTLHAEASAIRDAVRKGIDVRGKDLYVTRVNCVNRMSKPCSDCKKLIEEYGIRKVFYTGSSGTIIGEHP